MGAIVLRPRSPTEIVDASIEVYRRNPLHFILLTALVHAPWLILQLILLGNAPPTKQLSTQLLIGLGTTVSNFFTSAVVVQMASNLYLGVETDAFHAIAQVGWKLPRAFVVSLIQGVLFIVGLLFLFVPAVYWSALYFSAIPAVVLEHTGTFAAFGRSGALSRDLKWHILSAQGLVFIVRFAIFIGTSVLAAIVPNFAIQRMLASLVSVIVTPIAGISDALLYYDARIRREGFDIEMMAATGAGAVPEAAVI